MAGWGNKVEQSMYTVVPESWLTFDPRFLSKNIVVLPLKVSDNLGEASFVVDLITEAWGIDNGKRDPRAFLIEIEFCQSVNSRQIKPTNCRWCNPNALFKVSIRGIIRLFAL
jgi:hypothetical protein